jgi:glycosyltransferase involved in cell wall biosynthesis
MDHGPMQEAIDKNISAIRYDAILINLASMGFFDYRTSAKTILDAHNIEHDIWRRLSEADSTMLRTFWARYELKKFRPEEIRIFKKHDAMLLTSTRDKELADTLAPEVHKHVVPNGVDTKYFGSLGEPLEPHSVVFTGAMNYVPNTDAALFFVQEIFPRILERIPEAKVYFVGTYPPKRLLQCQNSQVVVTGTVDDVRPYVRKASAYIVPLRIGGGTRFKILEAMSMGRPIVTTTVGCEGIPIKHGETALIANDAQSFADCTVHMLKDRLLRERLVKKGTDLVRSSYEWDVIGKSLLAAIQETVGS